MNSINIEHIACSEFNRIVLQRPFRLVSEVTLNDKTPSFDGELIVYKDENFKKSQIEDFLKVQIKGITKLKFNKKLSFDIGKIDLTVFKQYGKSVLYIVVAINPETLNKQAYYKSLTPLEINRLLNEIEIRGNKNGVSVKFEKLIDGDLYGIANALIKNARKQPQVLIDVADHSMYSQFKLEFDSTIEDLQTYDIFEETAYIYGLDERTGQALPIEAMIPSSLMFEEVYEVELDDIKQLKVRFEESKKFIDIIIEGIFKLRLDKGKKNGKISVDEFNNLESYLKILNVLNYISKHEHLPFQISGTEMKLKIDNAKNLDNELAYYEAIKEIFNRIGIPENYMLEDKCNINKLISKIYNIFKGNNFELIKSGFNPEEYLILNLELQKDLKLLLYYDKEIKSYRNLFDITMFKKIAAFIPKEKNVDLSDANNSYRMSIFCGYEIGELNNCVNFDFEVYKSSFNIENHYPLTDINIQIALKLISYYDETNRYEYLSLAQELLVFIQDGEIDKVVQVNLLQIKIRLNEEFQDKDYEFLELLMESKDITEKFCATVLLKNNALAKRIYAKMNIENQQQLNSWPIYKLLKDAK